MSGKGGQLQAPGAQRAQQHFPGSRFAEHIAGLEDQVAAAGPQQRAHPDHGVIGAGRAHRPRLPVNDAEQIRQARRILDDDGTSSVSRVLEEHVDPVALRKVLVAIARREPLLDHVLSELGEKLGDGLVGEGGLDSADKLPKDQAKKLRNIGLIGALAGRLGLLFAINWVMKLTDPLITIEWLKISGDPKPLKEIS